MYKFSFHPGETIVLNFTIPFDIIDVAAVVISFRGKDRVAFEALATAFTEENEYETDSEGNDILNDQGEKIVKEYRTRVGYTLTQAESLQFDEYSCYKLQLNVYGPNGSRITSKEIDVKTEAQHLIDAGYGAAAVAYGNGYGFISQNSSVVSYKDLADKPQINSVELDGNRVLPEHRITQEQIDNILSE